MRRSDRTGPAGAARRVPWSAGVALALALVGARAEAPVVIHPDESVQATLSTATRDACVTLYVDADRDETITIEARSFGLDVKVGVWPSTGDPTTPAAVEDDNGLAGTDAAAVTRVTAGSRYRIEVRPADFTEEAQGEVEIAVRRGAVAPIDAAARDDADRAYWTAVKNAGTSRNDPWLRLRGQLGLARLAYGSGDYADMARGCQEAAAIATEAWGNSDGRRGVAMAELGLARYLSGDLAGAREAINEALPVLEARFGPNDERLAIAASYRGLVEEDLGELRIARDAYERSLAIRERRFGIADPSIVSALGKLSSLEDALGAPEKALAGYRRALAIVEGSTKADVLRQATLLNNIAFELKQLGRIQEAISTYERSLAIRREKLGNDHPAVAVCLQNLAVALHETGETDKGLELILQALAIREARLGPDHPDVAVTLSNLARLFHESGRNAEALPLIDRALAIRVAKLGPTHPDTTKLHVLRSRILAALGRTPEALTEALDAEELSRSDAIRVARFLPETRAMQYAARRAAGLDAALSAATATAASAGDVRRIWQAALRSRALVLDEMARRAKAIRAAEDKTILAAQKDAEQAVGAWTRLVSGGGGLRGDALRAALDASRRDLEIAERRLAEVSASYRREVEAREATWDDVSRAIPSDAALVAFVRYERGGRSPAAAYVAFVRPQRGESRLVGLGDAKLIDAKIASWRTAIAATTGGDVRAEIEKENRAREAGAALRRAIWDPVRATIRNAAHVVVVPDGPISLVPLAALPAEDGGYVVETGPLFQYVSAERDLLGSSAGSGRGPMLAMGGPSFDGSEAHSAAPEARAFRKPPVTACGEGPPLRFEPLPQAAREAEDVAKLVGDPGRVLVGRLATETSFKTFAPGSAVVHLATHGFVLGDSCAPAGASPLKLAGFALAGANLATAPGKTDDGILTAEEIATIDLSRTDWVALSACETGGGSIARGEGVLGLRRAFTIAGARTLVLTLWPVADTDARRFMKSAYRARFDRGLSPAEAVRTASLQILGERRARGLDTSPAHWGAFVATGR